MRFPGKWISVLVVATIVAGCQGQDNASDADAASTPAARAEAPAPPEAAAPARTGRIVIGDQSWTLVPATQCSIYPGPVIAIAGHAAENEAIEISIDFDGGTGGLIQASVENPDGSLGWRSTDDSLSIGVEGGLVTGKANFTSHAGGSATTVEGTFEVNCS